MNLAGWTKQITGKPTISVGSVGLDREFFTAYQGQVAEVARLDELLERMGRDEFDLIAVGRGMLANPDWVERVKGGGFERLAAYQPEHRDALI